MTARQGPAFPPGAWFEDVRGLFEEALAEGLAGGPGDGLPEGLRNAAAHAVLAGGKRLRPFLCVSAAQAAGGGKRRMPRVLACAAAVECLHAYTLVHDDLPCMDNDRERRGKPSVWAAFGEGAAVLAGDWLQAAAFGRVLRPGDAPAARAALELSRAAARVVAGQALDVKHAGTRSRARVEAVHADKTAALFEAAVVMGGLAAGATERETAALRGFGRRFGMAFQIADDIADAGETGRARKELSMRNVMGAARARALLGEHVEAALGALGTPGCFGKGDVAPLAWAAGRLGVPAG